MKEELLGKVKSMNRVFLWFLVRRNTGLFWISLQVMGDSIRILLSFELMSSFFFS